MFFSVGGLQTLCTNPDFLGVNDVQHNVTFTEYGSREAELSTDMQPCIPITKQKLLEFVQSI